MNQVFSNIKSDTLKLAPSNSVPGDSYILCSAIWFKDGQVYQHQPKNIDAGFVVCGRRHSNCYKTAWIFNMGKVEHLLETNNTAIEGFLTSDNQFLDRKKGAEAAFKAGQIPNLKDSLFSEDLYYY